MIMATNLPTPFNRIGSNSLLQAGQREDEADKICPFSSQFFTLIFGCGGIFAHCLIYSRGYDEFRFQTKTKISEPTVLPPPNPLQTALVTAVIADRACGESVLLYA